MWQGNSFFRLNGEILSICRFQPPVRASYAEGKQNLSQQTYRRCFQVGVNCSTVEECLPMVSDLINLHYLKA